MTDLIIYLAVGAFAGTLAGLLGVGGGLVIVPVLAFVFTRQGFDPAVLMHLAIGTSLATIVFTSVSSVYAHHRRGAVLWPVFWRLIPGIIVGVGLGVLVADRLGGEDLRTFFGLFELAVAAQLFLNRTPAPARHLPRALGIGLAGGVIGAISAVVGIGGGSLTVPFLVWCNVQMRDAVATSAACGLPIAATGALSYSLVGAGETALPPWSTGYLYWPALFGIVVASVTFAPLGARLAHALPAAALKRFFAAFLALLGLYMLWG